ncbi:MAG: helix-turn-helix domain-containing protein, partial [Candidatus Methylomirabilales bacterium]
LGTKYAKPGRRLSDAAAVALSQYHWPGNVRELRHVMERAVISSTGEVIQLKDLSIGPSSSATKQMPQVQEADLAAQFPAGGISLPRWERQLIEKALQSTGGNTTQAARVLGITRDTLRSRMRKYKIRRHR